MKNLLPDEWVALGLVITGAIGGFIGWIKAYEQAAIEQPLSLKLWGITRRMIMGGFVGFLVYQFTLIYSFSTAWGYVGAGILGVFAAEGLELGWHIVKARVSAMTRTPEPPRPGEGRPAADEDRRP